MGTTTLSTKGQLVIPTRYRKALHLQPGDAVSFTLSGDKLVIQREAPQKAKLVKGKFGRRVLIAPPGAPEMTAELIRTLRDDS